MMMITKPAAVGAVVALAGHGLAVGVTMIAAVAVGGGSNADLDSGDKWGVLMIAAVTYGIAQIALIGVCIAARGRLGPLSLRGLIPGWLLGLGASIFFLCGGLSA